MCSSVADLFVSLQRYHIFVVTAQLSARIDVSGGTRVVQKYRLYLKRLAGVPLNAPISAEALQRVQEVQQVWRIGVHQLLLHWNALADGKAQLQSPECCCRPLTGEWSAVRCAAQPPAARCCRFTLPHPWPATLQTGRVRSQQAVALQQNAPQWPPPQYAPRPPLRLEDHQRDAAAHDPALAQVGIISLSSTQSSTRPFHAVVEPTSTNTQHCCCLRG